MSGVRWIDGGFDHPPYALAGAHDDPEAPVLVVVHGIARQVQDHAHAFDAAARTAGLAVVAPLFDAHHYPDYQRLGRRGRRADLALLAVLADFGQRRGCEIDRVHLFGFSGGAQFAHRFALARPARVGTLLLAAAGWYTMPRADLRFPYGLAPCRRLPDLVFRLPPFLRRRIRVYVGAEDTRRDETVRQQARIDALQGSNRRERAERWCEALAAAARALGIATDLKLEVLPRAGHDFASCIDPARGDLIARVMAALDSTRTREEMLACAA